MPASGAHTVKAFDQDLDELRAGVAAVGGWAEAALREGMEALLRVDPPGAASALDRARIVAVLAEDVERRALCLIALRAPRADDLRQILTCLKILGYLRRIAGHAETVIASVAEFDSAHSIESPVALGRLARTVLEAIQDALDAFAAQDPSRSRSVSEASHRAEAHYAVLLESCLGQMRRDPKSIPSVISFLFAARGLARSADQAASIAGAVSFGVTGSPSPRPRREPADLIALSA